MTPTQIETSARNRYNASTDTFYSQAEIFDLIWAAEYELAVEADVIESTYSTSTVIGQQDYSYPTTALRLKRVTWNGNKLVPINMREDDALTLMNSATSATGNPQYYFQWDRTISLRVVPSSVQTLKLWTYDEPSAVTASSTLSVPSVYHADLIYYVLREMAGKDENQARYQLYDKQWLQAVVRAKRNQAKRKRADGFGAVMDEEALPFTILGAV